MAKGKKNKLQNNPFYPARKESLLKEAGTTIGVVVVCLILVGLIVKFFNVYAIDERKHAKDFEQGNEYYEADSEYPVNDEMYEEFQTDEYQQEPLVNEPSDEIQQEPLYDDYGNIVQEELHQKDTQDDAAYVLPDSNSRYLSYADLDGLSAEQLRIARNEIYARHGRMFKDAGLQAYFDAQPWYVGTIPAENFTQSMLSAIEIANAELISEYEARMGY